MKRFLLLGILCICCTVFVAGNTSDNSKKEKVNVVVENSPEVGFSDMIKFTAPERIEFVSVPVKTKPADSFKLPGMYSKNKFMIKPLVYYPKLC